MKRIVLILIFTCLPFLNFAQECGALMKPVSLKKRIAEASVVIEGVIVSSEAHWDTSRHNIYTVHTIETYKSFKGNTVNTIKMVTLGGEVDGAIQITSSAPNLSKGTTGIFLMKDFNKEIAVEGKLYQLVAAAQGIVKYDKHTDEASDLFNKYTSVENELYGKIQLSTNRTFTSLKSRPIATSKRAALATPIIYSFSPLTATAGTQTVLTITGNNFGTDLGSVGFSNANDGASSYTTALDSQIISWSNTEIQVEIPYLAGTGSIEVTNANNESQTTTVPLTISYSHLNGSTGTNEYASVLQDDNGNGGFTFVYHTDFDTSSAKTYFEDAFELWNCESSINFVFDGTTTTDESVEDGVNIVRFDNGSELASGVLGQVTTRYLGSCASTGKAIANEIDITWDDSTNWYYGSGDPSASQYDFKTVALHELGHAHQLGHVIDTDLVMHYSLGAGENKYSLAANDIAAAQYVMGEFTTSPGCSVTPMSSNVLCCDDIAISSQPQDTTIGENSSGQFSVTASGYDAISWFSSSDGNAWTMLSDDSVYSGTTTATLTLSSVPISYEGLFYRAYLENVCGEFLNTDQATLTVYEYTAIPDANFEAALEALGYDDISGDGQVPTYLIENVTSLDVQYSNISDLTGIEDFTDLQYVQVRNNNLTSLDLSANTALVTVAFRENSISTFDISNSPNVTHIYAAYNNLTTVDLSANTQLQVLAIRNNSLATIDLSNNTALTDVNVRDNSLTSLDLRNGFNTNLNSTNFTGNSNLNCIFVDDATYSTTNWTNIDAQTKFSDTYCQYTTIPDANFEAALEALGYDDISGDGQVPTALIENITTLDVSSNSILDLTGIEDFKALESLDCASNSLTSLDITQNTALTTLDCQVNSFTELDISNNINLLDLRINTNSSLTTLDLSANINLTSLRCYGTGITTLDISNNTALGFLQTYNTNISTLNTSNNPALYKLECYNTNITSLDLTNNTLLEVLHIGGLGFTDIDLSNNTLLYELRLNGNAFTSLDLSPNAELQIVRLQGNNLSYLNIQNGNNTNITQFNTTSNPDLNCILVDDEAYSTTNWTNIDSQTSFKEGNYCNYTAIPDANFEAALEALGYDDISGDGQVPTALIENVTSLQIAENSISDVTGLEDFAALTELDFYQIGLPSIDLSNNTLLQKVSLDNNPLTGIDLSTLVNLTELSLELTNITSIDVSANTALVVLDVSDNDFLNTLNVRNGNNIFLTTFDATNNPNLTCISVDDLSYSNTNWSGNIDSGDSFTETNYCDYTAIPDANFEIALNAQNYDDILGDGQVPTALIENVTNLDLSSEEIVDFTGIEDFASLSILNISENVYTTLDLSNNTNLTYFEAYSCGITSLDISQNTNLEELVVYSNSLTSLDTSNNLSLTHLTIYDNQITGLDLSSNTALIYLEANDNQLTELNIKNGTNTIIQTFDATGNSNLSCISVDDISYSNSNWTNIDSQTFFSENDCNYTSIPDANFEARLEALGYDDISGDGQAPTSFINTVTSLSVQSQSISDLTGIEDFTALESLDCRSNSLTSLDLSNNTALTSVDARSNDLTSIDVSNSPNLTSLKLNSNSNLETLDISNNTLLEILECYYTNISSLDISNNSALRILYMYGTNVSSLDTSNNSNLEKLECYSTNITSIDVTKNPSLSVLHVGGLGLPEIDLSNNTLLSELRLNGNTFTSLDLSSNTALKTVALQQNNLSYLNIKNGNNTNITGFNVIDNAELTCITVDDALYSSTNWTNIDSQTSFSDTYCRYTAIPDANFEAALEALGYDDISGDGQVPTAIIEAVTTLNVSNSGITDITGIEDFTALTTLTVSNNSLGTLTLSNGNLSSLDANYCDLTSIDVSQSNNLEILRAHSNALTSIDVSNNTALTDLNVYGNQLTTIDVSSNTLLDYLDLFQNQLTTLDISNNLALRLLYCDNNNLTTLDLSLHTQLTTLDIANNELESLNIQNGNNTNVTIFRANGNADLTCILVDDATYSTNNWTDIDVQTSFTDTACTTDYIVAIDVFLQGAALNPNTGEENLMRDDLRVAGLIPTTSPYADALTCDSTVFDTTGNDAIVDWVLVEVRDATDSTIITYSQSALLQRDGDVVDVDGTSNLVLSLESDTNYIAVQHRNHLGIMTISAATFGSTTTTYNINFVDTSLNNAYGSNAQTTSGMPDGIQAMWAGDANGDGIVQYSGNAPETSSILSYVLNYSGNFLGLPSWSIDEYSEMDLNLDQTTQYTGTNTDVPIILQNVLANPANFLGLPSWPIEAQLPEIIDATMQERKNLEMKFNE